MNLGVGDGSVIRNAILDKECRIGRQVVIDNAAQVQTENEDADSKALYFIRDGIVVIPRGAIVPDGTRIPAQK